MILLDIDGVCYDIVGAIKNFVPSFRPEGVCSYDFSGCDLGCDRSEVLPYLSSPKAHRSAELYNNVEEGVELLKSLDTVACYTSINKDIYGVRLHQLHRLHLVGYIFFDDVEHDGYIKGEKPVIENDVVAIIEDNPKTLAEYRDTNVYRIIIDRPYNRDTNEYDVRCKDLVEAYKVLKALKY